MWGAPLVADMQHLDSYCFRGPAENPSVISTVGASNKNTPKKQYGPSLPRNMQPVIGGYESADTGLQKLGLRL